MNLVQRKQDALALVEKQKSQLLALVANDKNKFAQYKAVMIELSQNKSLVNCQIDSIIKTATRIIQLGLNPNPLLGEAYVIARGIYEKQEGQQYPQKIGEEAELQIGVKGYKILGFRSGWTFAAEAVYKCDKFSMELGEMEPIISLIPDFEKRSEDSGIWVYQNLLGIIVFAKDPNGSVSKKFVRRAKLEKIRQNSPTQKFTKNELKGIWLDWAEEMYSKSALKYTIKREPIDSSVMAAIIADEDGEREDEVEVIETHVVPNAAPSLKKGKDVAESIQNMGLTLYPFENKAVVEGDTFKYSSILKDLGFSCENNEWYFLFIDTMELIEACLPKGVPLMEDGLYTAIKGRQDEALEELLKNESFKWMEKKEMWVHKSTQQQAA